jgi:hypothetical protein
MNLKKLYEENRAKWTPEVGDNPDNFWFYSAWYAVKVILGCAGIEIDTVNCQIHLALCMSHGDWDLFIKCLEKNAPQQPKRPEKPYTWDNEPTKDLPGRARRIFETQFRGRFKGKRLNSKFANEKWEEVREAALELGRQEFEREHCAYRARERQRNADYQPLLKVWFEDCDKVARAHKAINFLTEKEVACSPAFKSSA